MGPRRSLKRSKKKKKYIELNEKRNTSYQNVWGTEEAVPREKPTLNAEVERWCRSLGPCSKLPLWEARRVKEAPSKQREESNQAKSKNQCCSKQKNHREINETKSWFFEKVNKVDKCLVRLTKKTEGTGCQCQESSQGYSYRTWGYQKIKKEIIQTTRVSLIT